jgi:quercetin dioxygenase-like cupin family protein
MSETTYLNGKVRKHSLPVFQTTSGTGLPRLKRLLLPQGELAHFYDGDEGVRYIALIELKAGGLRGNHYHEHKDEGLYMLEGELLVTLKDPQTGEGCSLSLRAGELALIQPGVAHVLKTVHPGRAVEFSTVRFNAADVRPCKLM